ncbi:hypothetical protein JAAARDRAFT_192431 [Jaapia argillacea MUCL 33604]|uniref:DUF6533 domain-containing protein n=1 Tax=Jaapia argillacea MUCL 33604 TaxID=933084 RepID=A0A067Q8D6_9AGAM|nr:hypothetical protein JAAARDRAFT_192431 [Jaapia argillacea MUCL 33604]
MQGFEPAGFVQNLQLLRLFQFSGTILTIYDHSILFDHEVELIWKRPGIIAKIFFFLTRYCGDAIVVAILIPFLTEATSDSVSVSSYPSSICSSFGVLPPLCSYTSSLSKRWLNPQVSGHFRFLLQIWVTIIPAWVVQVIMQFRVYALYNRAKWVLVLTFTCFIIELATVIVFLASYQNVQVTLIQLGAWSNCVVTEMPADAVGPWLSAMAFEGILFFLALYKTVVHLLRLHYPWTRNSVTQVLLRDHIFYFFVVFSIYCLTVLAWYTFPIIWIEIFSNLNVAAICILGSRLLLNIREASYRHEECVNTQEIEFQLRALVDAVERGALASEDDPADGLAGGSHDDNGGEGESRQMVV